VGRDQRARPLVDRRKPLGAELLVDRAHLVGKLCRALPVSGTPLDQREVPRPLGAVAALSVPLRLVELLGEGASGVEIVRPEALIAEREFGAPEAEREVELFLERDCPRHHALVDPASELEVDEAEEGQRHAERLRVAGSLGRHNGRSGVWLGRGQSRHEPEDVRQLEVDLRLEPGIVADLGERSAVQLDCIARSSRPGSHHGEPAENRRPGRPRRGIAESFLEQGGCAPRVAGVARETSSLDDSLPDRVNLAGRSQPTGLLGQLGRRSETSASGRPPHGRVEGFGDACVRSGRGQRQVSCLLLAVGDEAGEAGMQSAPRVSGHPRGDRRREQRMGKADTVAVELEHPRTDRVPEAARVASGRGVDETRVRLGERGDDPADLLGLAGEELEPLVDERLQRVRDRQGITGLDRTPPPLEGAGQLQGEKRVPAGRLPNPQQHRPWEGGVEPASEELVECAHAERAELQLEQALAGRLPAQPGGHVAPDGQQRRDWVPVEALERIADKREGRRVQPLDVVDGERERLGRGKPSEHAEHGERDDSLLHRIIGVREGEGGLQGPPLRPRKVVQHVADDPAHQVREAREREPCPRLRGPTRQHEEAARPRLLHCHKPEGRLPDPRLPSYHGCRGQGRLEQGDQRGEFFLPAHQPLSVDRHEASPSIVDDAATTINAWP
jgi:hypothetical protein